MSESQTKDSVQDGRDQESNSKLLRFCIDLDDEKRYDKMDALQNQGKMYDFVLVTSTEYSEAYDEAAMDMVAELEKPELQYVAAIYPDIITCFDGMECPIKYNPTMSARVYRNKHMLNSPFLVRGQHVPKFSHDIKCLHLWSGILNLLNNKIVFHYPKQCFVINDFRYSHPSVREDIEKINKIYE